MDTITHGCVFPGCGRGVIAKGYCNPHYEQQRRGIALRPLLEVIPLICCVEGCTRAVHVRRRQLCMRHYDHYRKGFLGGHAERNCINCGGGFEPTRADMACCSTKCSMETSGLRWRYGITGQELEGMIAAQGSKCAICETPMPRGRNCHVDHDHACCEGERTCGKCIRG